jgi:hypothetical protein
MRFKNLLGLLAIGGAVAYAQKKRGGDLSLNGIKNSLRSLADNVKGKLDSAMGSQSAVSSGASNDIDRSTRVGSSSVGSEYSSGYSSNNGSNGSNGTDRKY